MELIKGRGKVHPRACWGMGVGREEGQVGGDIKAVEATPGDAAACGGSCAGGVGVGGRGKGGGSEEDDGGGAGR